MKLCSCEKKWCTTVLCVGLKSLVILINCHGLNIQRLAAEGKLVVAGPFLDKQPIRGIYIFNVSSIEEAKQLTETDPSIQAGTLEMELHPWYGSAALMEVVRIHKTLEKAGISK